MDTLQAMEYGEKHCKMWKMRNVHCRGLNMARKLKNVEKCERHTVGPTKWQKTKQNKTKKP